MRLIKSFLSPLFLFVLGVLFILAALMMYAGSKGTEMGAFPAVVAVVGCIAVTGGFLRIFLPSEVDSSPTVSSPAADTDDETLL